MASKTPEQLQPMEKTFNQEAEASQRHASRQTEIPPECHVDTLTSEAETFSHGPTVDATDSFSDTQARSTGNTTPSRRVSRGLTAEISPKELRGIEWERALIALNRFRVIRALDIAAICYPERPFKTALSAAQRTMRSLRKAGFINTKKTDRHQTINGLTVRGARWLDEQGVNNVSASGRRVASMSNPEHRLWMNFIVACCEVRGLQASTESELLEQLSQENLISGNAPQGLLTVHAGDEQRRLRPDAIAIERDGLTWFEIDNTKRGSDRRVSLRLLAGRVGAPLENRAYLRRVVVLARGEQRLRDALTVLRNRVRDTTQASLTTESARRFVEVEEGMFEVWAMRYSEAKAQYFDICVGHVIVQQLPVWLPSYRSGTQSDNIFLGWFDENYLPYRRPRGSSWGKRPNSPFITP
ncbi:hypothetical protein [Caballeronia calidae]|nr:hypothetical protein [Caballeronia calidae]